MRILNMIMIMIMIRFYHRDISHQHWAVDIILTPIIIKNQPMLFLARACVCLHLELLRFIQKTLISNISLDYFALHLIIFIFVWAFFFFHVFYRGDSRAYFINKELINDRFCVDVFVDFRSFVFSRRIINNIVFLQCWYLMFHSDGWRWIICFCLSVSYSSLREANDVLGEINNNFCSSGKSDKCDPILNLRICGESCFYSIYSHISMFL